MSSDDRWLLPEGIEEALPEQATRLEQFRRELIDLYTSWGYELVMPPFIEFLESLLTGTGQDLDLQTFKLTDQLSGRMMGVRCDLTPQVARIDAHRLNREQPTRLSYLGTALKTRPDGFAGSRSPLQIGGELYGHDGVSADLEIISLMMETLATCGVDKAMLTLGHVGILNQIAAQLGMQEEQKRCFFEMLQRKAVTEVDSWLAEHDYDAGTRSALASLALLGGGIDSLAEARQRLAVFGDDVAVCLGRLETLAEQLQQRYPQVSLHFDLSEHKGYHYETGVVFAAYVPGEGQEIARGGRYDGIGKAFGRERAAVGFSADLKTLSRLSNREASTSVKRIFAPAETPAATVNAARAQGDIVICALGAAGESAATMNCAYQLVENNGQWTVESV